MAKSPAKLQSLARSYCEHSLFVIQQIRDDPKSPRHVRLRAADMLLDRGLGKPAQMVLGDPERPLAATFDLRELARIVAYVVDRGSMPREGELLEIAPQRTGERDNGAGPGS